MASTKTRQRKLERDRYERKLVRRAQQQRNRRRWQAGLGAFLTVSLIGVGTAWLLGAFDPPAPEEPTVDRCFWEPQEGPERIDVGLPPGSPPTAGTSTVTVALDAGEAGSGEITIEADAEAEPCGVGSLTHLAERDFYTGTTCHQITAEGALRCGDPGGTGEGGPAYAFYGENFPFGEFDPNAPTPTPTPSPDPEQPEVLYPAGTVAFADVTGAQGSQLLFFFEDYAPETAIWPILGTVTDGMDLLEAIGAAGAEGEAPGPPAQEVRIESLTATAPEAPAGS